MDPVKMEKLQATERYRRSHFLPMFIQYVLRVVLVGLFLSCPSWLPSICSSINFFFSVGLPNIGAMVSGPKFIFLVSNIIIVFLVGESRLSKTSAQPDVYDEYVMQRQSLQKAASTVQVKEKEAVVAEPLFEETEEKDREIKGEKIEEVEEVKGGAGEEEMERGCEDLLEEEDEGLPAEELNRRVEDFIEMERGCEDLPEEEDEGLPAEELNRRVEDFIAKVNMQRKLEARMLICYE